MSVIDLYQSMGEVLDPDSNRCVTFQRDTEPSLTEIGGLWTNGFEYVHGTTATLKGRTRNALRMISLDHTNALWTCKTCKTSDISLFQACCGKTLSFDEVCMVIQNQKEDQMQL
jgi:hypothetical protein